MKKIKLHALKNYSLFLTAILTILGIGSSCNSIAVEYGSPSAKFIAKGTILSSDSLKAIEGIQVVFSNWDTTYSDHLGHYSAEIYSFPEKHDYLIQFNDIDGSINGRYLDKDTLVEFDNPTFRDGIWSGSDTERQVDTKLNRK